MFNVDNAIIMAAGTSSRFAPLSYERPKGLTVVKGEVLIERQIRQLKESGIKDIIVVTGYKKEAYAYLAEQFGVTLVHNPWFASKNNNSSIYAVRKYLHNSYVCSSDNYFTVNPFECVVDASYYSTVYAQGSTSEWCIHEDSNGYITDVHIGGSNAWYMLGHVFWDESFSRRFVQILEQEYDLPETADKLWETILIEHLSEFHIKARHYSRDVIFEFDTLDELRQFDPSYLTDSRSIILKETAEKLHCKQSDIVHIQTVKSTNNQACGFTFVVHGTSYHYDYLTHEFRQLNA